MVQQGGHKAEEREVTSPAPGKNTSVSQSRLGANQVESRFEEKGMGVLADRKLNLSQQCVLSAKKSNPALLALGKTLPTGQGVKSFPFW